MTAPAMTKMKWTQYGKPSHWLSIATGLRTTLKEQRKRRCPAGIDFYFCVRWRDWMVQGRHLYHWEQITFGKTVRYKRWNWRKIV